MHTLLLPRERPTRPTQTITSVLLSWSGCLTGQLRCTNGCMPAVGDCCGQVIPCPCAHVYGSRGDGFDGSGPALKVSCGVGSVLKMLRTGCCLRFSAHREDSSTCTPQFLSCVTHSLYAAHLQLHACQRVGFAKQEKHHAAEQAYGEAAAMVKVCARLSESPALSLLTGSKSDP
jgi:hypothetical protein